LGTVSFDDVPVALKGALSSTNGELSELVTQLETEQKSLARKQALEKSLPLAEKALAELMEKLNTTKQALVALAEQVKAETGNQEKQAAELKFESEAKAKAHIDDLRKKKQALEEALIEKQKLFEKAAATMAATQTEIDTLKTGLANAEPIDLEALQKEKAETSNQHFNLTEQNGQLSTRKSHNQSALEGIKKSAKQLSEMTERYKWMKTLADTANGDLAGKEKIKLETYIQTAYFERIIKRANIRFMEMSFAQYELKRRGAAGDLRSQSGLDLCVIDHYNASERDVRTLSGGESFIAALSLALGLSDEIQSYAGGIRLDSMFVDEGFGSLDESTLAQAMQALQSISQSNRLIGIISHVGWLQEKIERRIVVTKEQAGSSKVELL
jgi:exonuclease SbcC